MSFDDLSPEQQAAVERQRAQGATHVPARAPAPKGEPRDLFDGPSLRDVVEAHDPDGSQREAFVEAMRAGSPPPPSGDERAARERRGLPSPPAALPALPAPPPGTDALVTVGVDPGLNGGLACVVGSRVLRLERTPTRVVTDREGNESRTYDLRAMGRLLFALPAVELVVIEQQQAYPSRPGCKNCACVPCRSSPPGRGGQGTVSAFTTGCGYGMWLGLLTAAELPWRAVDSKAWKKALGVLVPPEARRKKGERPRAESPEEKRARSEKRRAEGKRLAVERAGQLFPSARLVPQGCRRPHDGVAEALLLARFGRLIRANDGVQ